MSVTSLDPIDWSADPMEPLNGSYPPDHTKPRWENPNVSVDQRRDEHTQVTEFVMKCEGCSAVWIGARHTDVSLASQNFDHITGDLALRIDQHRMVAHYYEWDVDLARWEDGH